MLMFWHLALWNVCCKTNILFNYITIFKKLASIDQTLYWTLNIGTSTFPRSLKYATDAIEEPFALTGEKFSPTRISSITGARDLFLNHFHNLLHLSVTFYFTFTNVTLATDPTGGFKTPETWSAIQSQRPWCLPISAWFPRRRRECGWDVRSTRWVRPWICSGSDVAWLCLNCVFLTCAVQDYNHIYCHWQMLVHYHESFCYKNETTKELEIGRRDDRESLTSFVWPRRWALSIACNYKVRFQSLS